MFTWCTYLQIVCRILLIICSKNVSLFQKYFAVTSFYEVSYYSHAKICSVVAKNSRKTRNFFTTNNKQYTVSVWTPLNAKNDKTKALQLACKQVRYGLTTKIPHLFPIEYSMYLYRQIPCSCHCTFLMSKVICICLSLQRLFLVAITR